MDVGFIGLGRMGSPMARNLAAAGFTLTVYDLRADVSRDFADAHGARAAGDVAEVFAAADLVVTMLPNGAIVRAAVTDGLAGNAGGTGLIADMSSSAPGDTAVLAKLVAGHGWDLVDAPVSGGVARAVTGELSILAGGSACAVDRCQPMFDVLGKQTFRVGAVGSGHTMKALNNVMSAAGLLLASETLLLGRKHGLEPEVMLSVLNASTGRNHATETKIAPFVPLRHLRIGFRARSHGQRPRHRPRAGTRGRIRRTWWVPRHQRVGAGEAPIANGRRPDGARPLARRARRYGAGGRTGNRNRKDHRELMTTPTYDLFIGGEWGQPPRGRCSTASTRTP